VEAFCAQLEQLGVVTLRIIVKGTEHRIRDSRSECCFICTHKFPGNQRVYTSLNQIHVKANQAYSTLEKKRETPELSPPQNLYHP